MSSDQPHFDKLLRLIELERRSERARLIEEKQSLPLAELEARGLVMLDLECQEESTGLGGRSIVTLKRADGRMLNRAFSSGDLVSVAPRKAEVDSPPVGAVTQATRSVLQVAFDRHPPEWIQEGRLRVDLVANDVTTERSRLAIDTVRKWEKGVQRERREIILGNAPPRFEKAAAFEPVLSLNEEQRSAVSLSLRARDFALVHGPPGTGKSTVLSELAVQFSRQGKRLLCCAASNAAVDHLMELCLNQGLKAVRIGHPARVLPHLQSHTLDLTVERHPDRIAARDMFDEAFDLLGYARKQRSQGRSRSRFSNAREASGEAYKLMDEARVLEKRAVDSVLGSAQVVCATLSMLGSRILSGEEFDVALFDEATQAIEPLSLMAFVKAQTVVFAGDPQQLSPTVISQEAAREGLGVSLFERLLKAHGDDVKCMLKVQHRMHAELIEFPSREMYSGELRSHPDAASRTLGQILNVPIGLDSPPFRFIDTAGKGFDESAAAGTQSLRNEGEAELLEGRVRALIKAGLPATSIGIISPYRAQADFLREKLSDLEGLEVDSVDAFQGREKEVILVSLVRSNTEQQVGFLNDLRRMNVAITRARRHLLVVGDSATLTAHPFYNRFIERAHALGTYITAWEWVEDVD